MLQPARRKFRKDQKGRVDIYFGARLLGGIEVGDGCMIGANCVVTKSVAAGSVVLAPPNRVIPRSLSVVARR